MLADACNIFLMPTMPLHSENLQCYFKTDVSSHVAQSVPILYIYLKTLWRSVQLPEPARLLAWASVSCDTNICLVFCYHLFDLPNKQACSCNQPATVSRCGMIYLEPVTLGWRPLMLSWINTLPEVLSANNREFIVDFFEWVVDPLLEFVRKNCKVCAGNLYSRWQLQL